MKMKDNAKIIIAVAGGLLVINWFRKPVASVTTSEGFDLSVYGGPTTYPQPIKNFAVGIAKAEGFYVANSIPARAKNPGDLKLQGRPTLPGTAITQFDSTEAGWDALYRQLWLIVTSRSANYNLDMTIDAMARTWTATTAEQGAWAATVARQAGVDPSSQLWTVLV